MAFTLFYSNTEMFYCLHIGEDVVYFMSSNRMCSKSECALLAKYVLHIHINLQKGYLYKCGNLQYLYTFQN